MKKIKIQVCIILIGIFTLVIALSGCINNNNTDIFIGVSLSPKSYNENDFIDFFEKSKQTGNMVMWAGDWIYLNNNSDGAPRVLADLASIYGYTPLIEVTYFDQSTGELIRPLNETTKQIYISSAVNFCKEYNIEFFGIGIEVNAFNEKSPEKYSEFVQFYSEVYDAIKEESSDTRIFTVFQLEKLKGFTLWEEESYKPDDEQWHLIEDFPKLDVFAFTTYPCLIFKNPENIPLNYYTNVLNYTEKDIAITECGWHSIDSPFGWESSEIEQAGFVSTLFDLIDEIDYKILIWSFLYDQETIESFNSMGLRNNIDGSPKLSWNEWIQNLIQLSIEDISSL